MLWDAVIDGDYRYVLSRSLTLRPNQVAREGGPILWVMLNPSTATASKNDPTIRKIMGFSTRWGFREMRVVNLFALRSPQPGLLRNHGEPVGPKNDEYITGEAKLAGVVVCAWGVHGELFGRGAEVRKLLVEARGTNDLKMLALTKGGQPVHPLYRTNDSKYMEWT